MLHNSSICIYNWRIKLYYNIYEIINNNKRKEEKNKKKSRFLYIRLKEN